MRALLVLLSALIAFAVWQEGLLTGLLLLAAALFLGLGAAVFCYSYSCARQKEEEMWDENP